MRRIQVSEAAAEAIADVIASRKHLPFSSESICAHACHYSSESSISKTSAESVRQLHTKALLFKIHPAAVSPAELFHLAFSDVSSLQIKIVEYETEGSPTSQAVHGDCCSLVGRANAPCVQLMLQAEAILPFHRKPVNHKGVEVHRDGPCL